MDASEYKHVVLGLVFLKYVDDAFSERRDALAKELAQDGIVGPDAEELLESRDEYTGHGVFWVPPEARWGYLQANARQAEVGKLIDGAMDAIEVENPSLRGVLPKSYSRESLDVHRLGELVDLIAGLGLGGSEHKEKNLLGRVYEYFLGRFAVAEGRSGGEFYTPRNVVKVLVEMIEPYRGLADQVRSVSGRNVVAERRFSEVLERAMNAYNNRSLTAAEVISELVELAKQLREEQGRGKSLGLRDDELAFYDAVRQNDSAVLELGDEVLKRIAQELVEVVRANTSVDWDKKEQVRALLRSKVRRLLTKYHYPPDRQESAVILVMEQAERLAEEVAA